MTKSNIGKVFIGMVLMVGSARAGQWQFARESTLVPAGPDEAALGIQSLRVHSTGSIEILNTEQKVIGEFVDTKSESPAITGKIDGQRAAAPEETIELTLQGRRVSVHYKDRAIWISDGKSSASASFDQTSGEDVERVKAFADDLRLIAGIQIAARAATPQTTIVRTTNASVFGLDRLTRLIPASWSSAMPPLPRWLGGSPAKFDEAVCHTEPAHAKCAGGFGASRSSGCAYSQQEANNACAAASGWCYGCCAWVGSCDCACLFGDLACMCESCGGTCGPSMQPTPAQRPMPAAAGAVTNAKAR